MIQVVAPCAASRGNRLLVLSPSPSRLPSSLPLPCVLPGWGNVAAHWSASGSLSHKGCSRPSYQLGWGRRRQSALLAAADEPPSPPCQCGVEEERERARERGGEGLIDRESARERKREQLCDREKENKAGCLEGGERAEEEIRNTYYKSREREDHGRGTLSLPDTWDTVTLSFAATCLLAGTPRIDQQISGFLNYTLHKLE